MPLPGRDREGRAVPRSFEARRGHGPRPAPVARDVEVALAEPGCAGVGGIRRGSALADEGRVVAEVVVGVGAAERAGLPGHAAVDGEARRREPPARPHGRHADQRLAVGQQRGLCDLRSAERAGRERRVEAAPAVLAQPPACGVLGPDEGGPAGGDADPVDRRAATEAARDRSPCGRRKRRCRQDRREHEDPPPHPGIQAATDSLPARYSPSTASSSPGKR